jgi:type II secretion system protein N
MATRMRTPMLVLSLAITACSSDRAVEPPASRSEAIAPVRQQVAERPIAPRRSKAFTVEDMVRDTDDALHVAVQRRAVPLAELPVASLLAGLPMAGLADVSIDVTVPKASGHRDYRNASGSIALGCPGGCTLGDGIAKLRLPGTTDGIPFAQIAFDKVDVRAEIKDGRVEITRWAIESKDLTLDLTLNIKLAAELDDSTLDGCMRFTASPGLAKRDPITAALLATTGAPQGPDGVHSIKIAGRIGKRKLLGQICS